MEIGGSKMANEVVLINNLISDAQKRREIPLSDSQAFEAFSIENILKNRNLTDSDLEDGRIGGGGDGALDGIFVFHDGFLLQEDSELLDENYEVASVRKNFDLELVLIQAKKENSFSETAIDKVSSSIKRLLNLEHDRSDLIKRYNQNVVDRIGLFTSPWQRLISRSPKISIKFYYASQGIVGQIGHNVEAKAHDLVEQFKVHVPGASAEVVFVGARELWSFADAVIESDLQLKFSDYVDKGSAYAGLVGLPEYFKFLCDSNGDIRSTIFDSNVRDYQGNVAVNKEIVESLETVSGGDFWWLNNGITILCSNITIGGDKLFTLTNPQIVNGLQTSQSIYNTFAASREKLDKDSERSLLVRVIKTQDEEERDRIIRATNNQTAIQGASLHATENVHRQIEAHFIANNWFYDRRKNFYKNLGKSADRLIGISALGQAAMSIGLGRPNDARARPSTLLNTQSDYRSIFNDEISVEIYLWVAKFQKAVDKHLLEITPDASERNNFKFYISCYMAIMRYGSQIRSLKQLKGLSQSEPVLTRDEVKKSFDFIRSICDDIGSSEGWDQARTSKSKQLADSVIEAAVHQLTGGDDS